jgi:hypothetical protein
MTATVCHTKSGACCDRSVVITFLSNCQRRTASSTAGLCSLRDFLVPIAFWNDLCSRCHCCCCYQYYYCIEATGPEGVANQFPSCSPVQECDRKPQPVFSPDGPPPSAKSASTYQLCMEAARPPAGLTYVGPRRRNPCSPIHSERPHAGGKYGSSVQRL